MGLCEEPPLSSFVSFYSFILFFPFILHAQACDVSPRVYGCLCKISGIILDVSVFNL